MTQKFKLGKDIMKNKKEQIEKKVVELKTQFQDELTEKKNSIIADLESHEKSLLSVVKHNPWLDCIIVFSQQLRQRNQGSNQINLGGEAHISYSEDFYDHRFSSWK